MEVKPGGLDVHEYVSPLMPGAPIETELFSQIVLPGPVLTIGGGISCMIMTEVLFSGSISFNPLGLDVQHLT